MNDLDIRQRYQSWPKWFRGDIAHPDMGLVVNFFMVYSRFEFALKAAGYCNDDRGYLQPDWKAFCGKIEPRFRQDKTEQLSEACDYFLHHPPRIQALSHTRQLCWKDNQRKDGESDLAWILRSISIVRNNLFHGGKFPWDQMRDTSLLLNALVILYECLELDEKVSREFTQSSKMPAEGGA